MGVRDDLVGRFDTDLMKSGLLAPSTTRVTVRDVLGGMPKLRSGLSKSVDSEAAWRKTVIAAMDRVARLTPVLPKKHAKIFLEHTRKYSASLITGRKFTVRAAGPLPTRHSSGWTRKRTFGRSRQSSTVSIAFALNSPRQCATRPFRAQFMCSTRMDG